MFDILTKNQQQLEAILADNPGWNAIEAWEGLSGLKAGSRQIDAADVGGLNNSDTIRTMPAVVHERRRALFKFIPFIMPAETLWSLVEPLPYRRIERKPKPHVMAQLADLPWQMRRLVRSQDVFYIPPAHPVITTFQDVVGRDPKPEAIAHYLRDWEELNFNQAELRAAIISGMKA